MIKTDTIAAISTAMGNSGIGIVRISGKDAVSIIEKIYRSPEKGEKKPLTQSHRVYYGNIVDEKEILDEVLVLVMRAPHTYTREDVAEIDCHGGIYVTQRILDLVIKSGARLAEPGEFTRRAFENGRIDLAQAEAVIDVINAENNLALRSAVSRLKGSLSLKIREIREIILEETAFIEAALDDPEHIDMEGFSKKLLPVVEECKEKLTALIETADDGRIIRDGVKTVILGRPNVGKSTFMNALLGQDRAIVTDIAGTTRDVLEERVRLGDVVLNLADTAGIRRTENVIENVGVEKARKYAEDADLIIFVADASTGFLPEDSKILDFVYDKRKIILLNKTDLGNIANADEIVEKFSCPVIECVLKEGLGINSFADSVREMFYSGQIDIDNQVFVADLRQKAALCKAKESLVRVIESIERNMSEDFYTIDLMDAYASLGEVIGETLEDDLADEIFSRFCMGK